MTKFYSIKNFKADTQLKAFKKTLKIFSYTVLWSKIITQTIYLLLIVQKLYIENQRLFQWTTW